MSRCLAGLVVMHVQHISPRRQVARKNDLHTLTSLPLILNVNVLETRLFFVCTPPSGCPSFTCHHSTAEKLLAFVLNCPTANKN